MDRTNRAPAIVGLALLLLGAFMALGQYTNTVYSADRAIAFFSRAETAGFAEEFIAYVRDGRSLIPGEGNPVWILPTVATDFGRIQADLDTILGRAELLTALPRGGDAYQQGMDDLRGKILVVQNQIAATKFFLFVTPLNLTLLFLWIAAQVLNIVVFLKLRKRVSTGQLGAETSHPVPEGGIES